MSTLKKMIGNSYGKLQVFVAVTLSLICLSCTSPTMLEKQTQLLQCEPVSRDGSIPLSFHRLLIDIPDGTVLGAHYDGLMRCRMHSHTWEGSIVEGVDTFKIEATRELRSHGYRVLGYENMLFDLDNSDKARYLLGGTINKVVYNTYAATAGGFSESHVFITWEIFDTLNREIIFSHTTQGYGKSAQMEFESLLKSFKQALRELMADEQFIKVTTDEDYRNHAKEESSIEIKTSHQNLKLPEDIDKVLDAVVSIKAGKTHGTGFAISEDGYILTAAHIVSGLDTVHIETQSGNVTQAMVLQVDQGLDVALIKAHDCSFAPLELELDNRSPVGAEVFGVGTPISENFSRSTSKGVLSGYRTLDGKSYIQTDTSLNPGNSGGPLLNENGKVVGIVSWKISGTGIEGISFAIDVENVPGVLGFTLKKS